MLQSFLTLFRCTFWSLVTFQTQARQLGPYSFARGRIVCHSDLYSERFVALENSKASEPLAL